MASPDRPHRWPKRPAPKPDDEPTAHADDGEPDDYEDGPSTAADLLDSNRHRDYVRGRRYEVWVPSPFAKVNPAAMPSLRVRYFVRWETREDAEPERWPIFATEEEWLELRLAEHALHAPRASDEWLTLQEIAEQVGKSVRTIRRHVVERGECPFTEFGRTKKVRRSDFEEWLKKDLPVTKEIREVDSYRRDDF